MTESADPGWQAELDGRPLDLEVDPSGMLTAGIGTTGSLQLTHVGRWPYLAVGQLALMAALAVLSLPKRRPVDIDDPTLRGDVRDDSEGTPR